MRNSKISNGFGQRLRGLRKARALTQAELGERVGLSNRMVAYYEQQDAQPPGPLISELARALGVTADEILGLKSEKASITPKTAKLLKRVQAISDLPPSDQRAILRIIDGFLQGRGRAPSTTAA